MIKVVIIFYKVVMSTLYFQMHVSYAKRVIVCIVLTDQSSVFLWKMFP